MGAAERIAAVLPDSLQLLERGWLSSNNILAFDGEAASLIDSGYVTHAAQTVALVERALAGRTLTRVINTHSHSDHIGGNAALNAAFGCQLVVPEGLAATIAEWDEDALLLSPLGQSAARFQHHATYGVGDRFVLGGLEWQALAVPGHDMDALALYNPDERLLISGDALWEDGFGVIFAEVLGTADGLAATRATLDMLGRLSIDAVLPGHGPAFGAVDAALERAYRKLAGFEASLDRLARHAIKVIVAFVMLEKRRIKRADLAEFLASLSFVTSVNARYLGLDDEALADWLVRDLTRAGALREDEGWLTAG
ncbi:beta-lactamase [Oryzomicrobium terrae]|uniref:beta-lactamase n=1 Tax=Oryzomicrobium terrae TaxID=1735038 RepID=A0A5C1E550_9RHOO|nr:MBL fold metallo-hydrolase [Oryzomicrobium terrae]QEL63669.1 beta-lactamase [Oryzomicrobium terrae]